MSEIEAKVRYVKLARSLKTYGVSFFLVKVEQKLCSSTSSAAFQHLFIFPISTHHLPLSPHCPSSPCIPPICLPFF